MKRWQAVPYAIYWPIGYYKFSKGKYIDALWYFNKLLSRPELVKIDEQLYCFVGRCYFYLGKTEESLNAFLDGYNILKKKDFCELNVKQRVDALEFFMFFKEVLVSEGKTEILESIKKEIESLAT
jgi:hypothetical protein